MAHTTPASVLLAARFLLAGLVTVAVGVHGTPPAFAQPPAGRSPFTGIYIGAGAERVNVIGGAQVSGVDTLAQASRPAVVVVVGGRYALAGRIVLGVEAGFGLEDGTLRLDVPERGLAVDYRNRTHVRLGGTLGFVVGPARRTLLFGYVAESTRTFDVTIHQAGETIVQRDEQGLLRYGAGVERHLTPLLGLRASAGSSRADFGGRPANIKVERPLDLSVGLVVRF